jgi:hypothetical protein
METKGEDLREALAGLERRGRGRPYPKPLLERVLAHAAARRKQGATLLAIGEELGISWRTLSRWLVERRSERFRPVQIVAPRREVVLHGPRGLRVEGLDVDGLAELLRKLDP